MKYNAFGFVIDSEIEFQQLQIVADHLPSDVRICFSKLSESGIDFSKPIIKKQYLSMCPQGIANLRVTNGNLIEVEPLDENAISHIKVYILGSCMGAVIHQRGLFPIHGSCVTDGKHSIILSGESGSGKSTLASEFLRHGWKLLTDDVSVIKNIETGTPLVQSSYPSQKLWQDSLNRYNNELPIHSLYSRDEDTKFGVDVADMFYEGCVPLSLFVRLVVSEDYATDVQLVEGFGKVEQIRSNTYRKMLVEDSNLYFQRCITLGTRIPMALSIRHRGDNCATLLYEKIVSITENLNDITTISK